MAATPSWLMPTNAGGFPYETTPAVGALGAATVPAAAGGLSAPYQYNAGCEAPQAMTDLTVLYSKHIVDMVTIPRPPATGDLYSYIVLQGAYAVQIPAIATAAKMSGAIGIPLAAVGDLASGYALSQCLVPPAYLQQKTNGWVFGRKDNLGVLAAPAVAASMPIISVTASYQAAGQGLSQPCVFLSADPFVATTPASPKNVAVGLQLFASGTGADEANKYIPGFQIKIANYSGADVGDTNAIINYRICFPVPVNNV